MRKNYFKPAMRVVELKYRSQILQSSIKNLQSPEGLKKGGSDIDYDGDIR